MAKSKVPVARIEGAEGVPAAQERHSDASIEAAPPRKRGSASAVTVDSAAAKATEQRVVVTADAPREVAKGGSAQKAATSDESAVPKSAQEKGSERPRMKVVADPVVDAYTGGGQPSTPHESASTSGAHTAQADAAAHASASQRVAEPSTDGTEDPQRRLAWLTGIFANHSYAALGGICGLVVALLVFFVGFWKTLFICLLVLVGVAFGQYLDGDPKIVNRIRELVIEARGNN